MTYEQRIRSIRHRRTRLPLSLDLVGRKLGRTAAWLSLIELGHLRTTDENLQRIEAAIEEFEAAAREE